MVKCSGKIQLLFKRTMSGGFSRFNDNLEHVKYPYAVFVLMRETFSGRRLSATVMAADVGWILLD